MNYLIYSILVFYFCKFYFCVTIIKYFFGWYRYHNQNDLVGSDIGQADHESSESERKPSTITQQCVLLQLLSSYFKFKTMDGEQAEVRFCMCAYILAA